MSALDRLPSHLKKYVVEQNYDRYTAEDQAVWRYILRQLRDFLTTHAHECYLDGLSKTGIHVDEIPRIEVMDRLLSDFGWGAVPVSGFIPPAAFMEFQSLGILPIASDMRSVDHLSYTPAPDIVHEAAGHAPILINDGFAEYLRKYAGVARYAIISKEDLAQYHAIRRLSDVKENPNSSPEEIRSAERDLEKVNKSMTYVSEAGYLSRMNWWTAEYGLIGDLKNPRIYGAGLLSSVGEAKECLTEKVKKVPLDLQCIDVSYDITEPQPQLFVTPDFKTLHDVLEQLAERMSYRRGGAHGLKQALLAKSVNTVQLNSGLQVSGELVHFDLNEQNEAIFVKFQGPCQLSVEEHELAGHGTKRHAHGFSSPLGTIKGIRKGLSEFSKDDLSKVGIRPGESVRLEYESGIFLEGVVQDFHFGRRHLQLMTFSKCEIRRGNELLYNPEWGEFDLAVGEHVTSVFGGPADRGQFGATEDFNAERVPAKSTSKETLDRFRFYQEIRDCRKLLNEESWTRLKEDYLKRSDAPWLQGIELLEIGVSLKQNIHELEHHLRSLEKKNPAIANSIESGLRLSIQ